MAMLKTIGQGHGLRTEEKKAGHTGSTKDIDDYLAMGPAKGRKKRLEEAGCTTIEEYLDHGHGHDDRPMAFRHTANLPCAFHGWSETMDETRRAWGKDSGRTYYHFVISPDPEDRVSADECADIGLEWVSRMFPGGQAIVSVHDDNQGGIMHAHVILNSVYPETGRKVWRSNMDVVRESQVCQEICRERHLHELPDLAKVREGARRARKAGWRTGQARYMSMSERALRSRGGRSWVAQVRDTIDAVVPTASSIYDFADKMAERGYGVSFNRRGELVFLHPDHETDHDHRVRGERLGTDYNLEGIRARLTPDLLGGDDTGRYRKPQVLVDGRPMSLPAARLVSSLKRLERQSMSATGRGRVVSWRKNPDGTRTLLVDHGPSWRESLEAIMVERSHGIKSMSQLRHAVLMASYEAEAAYRKAEAVESAAAVVAGARKRAASLVAATRELENLPSVLTPESRERRNKLAASIAEDEAWLDEALSSSPIWVPTAEAHDMSAEDRAVIIDEIAAGIAADSAIARQDAKAARSNIEALAKALKTATRGRHRRLEHVVVGAEPANVGTPRPTTDRVFRDDRRRETARRDIERHVSGPSARARTNDRRRDRNPT